MKKLLILSLTALLVCSCSKFSVDVTKRKYRPGFFVEVSAGKETGKNKIPAAKKISSAPAITFRQQNDETLTEAAPIIAAGEQIKNSGAEMLSDRNEFHSDRSSSVAKGLTSFTEKYFPAPAAAGENFTYVNVNVLSDKSPTKSHHKGRGIVGKILLLLLALLLFFILLVLLGFAMVSHSDYESEEGAAAISILGIGGLIALLVIAIRAIFKKRNGK